MKRSDNEYAEFVRTRRGQLVATAHVLTAGDSHLAEDLVQTALVRVYLAWRKARRAPMAYARRTLVNCFIDHRRRPGVRREHPTGQLPDATAPSQIDQVDPELVTALGALPDRMRAAVVLRHVQDLSVQEVAALLHCTPGTVKSQTARGLDKLRAALESSPLPHQGTTHD